MRTRVALVAAAVFVAAAIGVAIAVWPSGKEQATATPTSASSTVASTTTTTAPPAPFEAGDVIVPQVAVYDAPNSPNDPIITLDNPTSEDVPLVLAVKQQGPAGWLEVQYNRRPNGATGWIHATDVSLRDIQNRVVISRRGHSLDVYKGTSDAVVFHAPVAVGAPDSPTPLGDFYVDIVVKLIHPTGPYGPYQLSVAGFSDVYQTFGTSAGQIAIHGTDQPFAIGDNVSHGCVRLSNEDVTALVPFAPAGTPVTVVE